jgi:hypothetical protein
MASNRRLQVGLALGFGLLAGTAACQQPEPPDASIAEPAVQTAAVTSLVIVTTPPVTIPLEYVEDCVAYVQFAAYVGISDMRTMWDAAGQDAGRLRDNCISLGRGDPQALAEISRRRVELDAFLGVTTTVENDRVQIEPTGSTVPDLA